MGAALTASPDGRARGPADHGSELAWVRLDLDLLSSAQRSAPLTPIEGARFVALLRRERELLGVV
jgi:hypothetical protein